MSMDILDNPLKYLYVCMINNISVCCFSVPLMKAAFLDVSHAEWVFGVYVCVRERQQVRDGGKEGAGVEGRQRREMKSE